MDSMVQVEKFLSTIKDLSSRLDNLERTSQPQLIDWYEYNPSYFTRYADNVITVDTKIIVENVFQIGDKVRINQGGYKYFYIIYIDTATNRITLSGGDDYVFTSSAFTSFGTSKLPTPFGHPLIFDYSTSSLVYTADSTTTYNDSAKFAGGDGIRSAKFSMNGPIVQVWFELGTTAMRSGILSVELSTPFLARTDSSDGIYLSAFLYDGSIDLGGGVYSVDTLYKWFNTTLLIGTHASQLAVLIGPRDLGASFSSGTWGWNGSIVAGI